LLNHGKVQQVGPVGEVLQTYMKTAAETEANPLDQRRDRQGDGSARVTGIKIETVEGNTLITTASRLRVTVDYESDRPLRNARFLVTVYDLTNTGIFLLDTDVVGGLPEQMPAKGSLTCTTDPIRLTPGRCYVNLALYKSSGMADHVEYAAYFDVESENVYGHGTIPERGWVLTVMGQQWKVNE
jgi:lipopolysaccharide transport system ATP-binding protein